jgi:hypothetical protein
MRSNGVRLHVNIRHVPKSLSNTRNDNSRSRRGMLPGSAAALHLPIYKPSCIPEGQTAPSSARMVLMFRVGSALRVNIGHNGNARLHKLGCTQRPQLLQQRASCSVMPAGCHGFRQRALNSGQDLHQHRTPLACAIK